MINSHQIIIYYRCPVPLRAPHSQLSTVFEPPVCNSMNSHFPILILLFKHLSMSNLHQNFLDDRTRNHVPMEFKDFKSLAT